jgi:hypothetical protein
MVRDNPELNKHVAEMTALGRAGPPDDIGPMIASLLSQMIIKYPKDVNSGGRRKARPSEGGRALCTVCGQFHFDIRHFSHGCSIISFMAEGSDMEYMTVHETAEK